MTQYFGQGGTTTLDEEQAVSVVNLPETLKMKDATQLPTNWWVLIYNYSSANFDVQDSTGSVLATVPQGDLVKFELTNNSTAAGTWNVVTTNQYDGSVPRWNVSTGLIECDSVNPFAICLNTVNWGGIAVAIEPGAFIPDSPANTLNASTNFATASRVQGGFLRYKDFVKFDDKVSSVSGSGAISVTAGSTPVVSVATADGLVPGVVSTAKYAAWDAKGNGTVTNVSGSGSVSVSNQTTTPVISIPDATGSVRGLLTAADWTTFNGKLSSIPAMGGDVTGTVGANTIASNAVTTAKINNAAVTFAKIQSITDNRLLGRSAGSSGDMQHITVGDGLSLASGTLSKVAPIDSVNYPSRSLNSVFTPNASKWVEAKYVISMSAALTLSGGQTGTVQLMTDGTGTPTTVCDDVSIGNSGSLVIGVAITNAQTVSVKCHVKPGDKVRLVTSGGATISLVRSVETYLN